MLDDAETILRQAQEATSFYSTKAGALMAQAVEIPDDSNSAVGQSLNRSQIPECRRAFYQNFATKLPKKHFRSLQEAEEYIKDHLTFLLAYPDHQPTTLGLSPTPSVPAALYDAWEYIFQLGWFSFMPNSTEVELNPVLA